MRFKAIVISVCFLFVIFLSNSMAQTSDDNSWNKIIHIQSGIFASGGGYSFVASHNDFPGLGSFDVSLKAKYKTHAALCGGFELSKGYFGFQGNFGFTPANTEVALRISVLGFSQSEEIESEINTYYGEGAFLFFPMGSGVDKIFPFVTVGAGGFGLSGASKEGGYFISYGGGVRIFLEENYGINIGLKGFYMDFGSILDEPELQGERLTLKPLQLTAGFMYRF
jgi:hypothetical protein